MSYKHIVIILILFTYIISSASAQTDNSITDFTVKDIHYLPRTISDFGEKTAYTFIFYSGSDKVFPETVPLIIELDDKYHTEEIQFVLVNTGAEETPMDMALFAMKYEIPFPIVRDHKGECAKTMGITKHPSVVILNSSKSIIYRGNINIDSLSHVDSTLSKLLDGEQLQLIETEINGNIIPSPLPPVLEQKITYTEHIAPIMQEHCEPCHRKNGIGPSALSSYNKVSANAEMLAEVVWEERMPPWYAHPNFGTFENDRRMSREEKLLLVNWVRQGSPKGDPEKLPEPIEYTDTKWLTNPDLIIPAKQQVALPATGYVPYQYISFDYVFEDDTYVQAIEIMPENPRVVHHANIFYTIGAFDFDEASNFLTGKVPGSQPSESEYGIAWLIPKGSVLRIQAHYVTTGKPERDRIHVGLRYAKEPIKKRLYYKAMTDRNSIDIPPFSRNWHMKDSKKLKYDVTGIGVFGHLHLRGKHFQIDARYPDGQEEILFAMPNYNFEWQMTYHYPYGEKKFPKGTEITSTAWYDNSPFNAYNPDPAKNVKTGPQSVDEMLNGFFVFTRDDENLNLIIDPDTGHILQNVASLK